MIDIINFMNQLRADAITSINSFAIPKQIEPLRADKWIICSLLQKSIRRGDITKAQQATITLMQLDKRMLISRLRVIALEDIGVGGIITASEVISATQYASWRKGQQGGELKVLLWAATRLAKAIKDRTGDSIYHCLYSNEYKQPIHDFAKLKFTQLANIIHDTNLPIQHRVIAACYMGGTKFKNHQALVEKHGDIEALFQCFSSLDISREYLHCCYYLAKNMNNILPYILPLVAERFQQLDILDYDSSYIHEPQQIEGIPLYAIDMHTRVGKQCYDIFQKQSNKLNSFIKKYNINNSLSKIVKLTFFHQESALCNKTLKWDFSKEIKLEEQITNLTIHGKLDLHIAKEFIEIIKQEQVLMDNIKEQELKKYFNNQPKPETLLSLI